MPPKEIVKPIFEEGPGKAHLFFTNVESNDGFRLQIDEELTLTTEINPKIKPHLPRELQNIPCLQMTYSGLLSGPGINKLFAFSRALRLVSDAPVFSSGTLFFEDESYSFHRSVSRRWSWGASKEQISLKDCEAAKKIYIDVLHVWQLEAEVYNRLTNAHRFFDNAYDQSNADMAIVGFTTALEGLLLNSEAELNFRFCLRTAQFLGASAEEKQILFARAKEIYACRSKIVHGAAIRKDNELADIYVVDQIAPSAQRLACHVLLKIYEQRLVNVFVSGERADKLFTQLLFAENSEQIISAHTQH